MFFGIIILIRILFIACMVFIIGYVFGSFSKKQTLATITKVATILVIILFIAANIFAMRWGAGRYGCWWDGHHAGYEQTDSLHHRY
jgi:hypothetical protein